MSSKPWWSDDYNEVEHQKDLASVGQAKNQQVIQVQEQPDNDETQYPRIEQQKMEKEGIEIEEKKEQVLKNVISNIDDATCRIKLEAIRDF